MHILLGTLWFRALFQLLLIGIPPYCRTFNNCYWAHQVNCVPVSRINSFIQKKTLAKCVNDPVIMCRGQEAIRF